MEGSQGISNKTLQKKQAELDKTEPEVLTNQPTAQSAAGQGNVQCAASDMDDSVCKDCLKWESYGEKCWVYWKGKKTCTLKVRNSDEWKDEHKFRQF